MFVLNRWGIGSSQRLNNVTVLSRKGQTQNSNPKLSYSDSNALVCVLVSKWEKSKEDIFEEASLNQFYLYIYSASRLLPYTN